MLGSVSHAPDDYAYPALQPQVLVRLQSTPWYLSIRQSRLKPCCRMAALAPMML